jgi:hypothetical protein
VNFAKIRYYINLFNAGTPSLSPFSLSLSIYLSVHIFMRDRNEHRLEQDDGDGRECSPEALLPAIAAPAPPGASPAKPPCRLHWSARLFTVYYTIFIDITDDTVENCE